MEDKDIFKKAVQKSMGWDWDNWDEYMDEYGWGQMFEIAIKFRELSSQSD